MFQAEDCINGFRNGGGWIDTDMCTLQPVQGMGIGLIALKHIPANTPLFHVPTSHILSPRSVDIQTHLSTEVWDSLAGGWDQLILGMMWEEAKGKASTWAAYFRNMPKTFSTPMFWTEEELKELVGTDIENRIGRADAEERYTQKMLPVIQAHPHLFPPSSIYFSLDAFHLQGSRILSRSFTIPADLSNDLEDDEDEIEDIAVMIPMADMLNAAHDRDNARLYNNEVDEVEATPLQSGFSMVTTKDIKAGEQIFNTYASPPNTELLRKYGHVDMAPLSPIACRLIPPEDLADWPFGNDADEVDIPGTLVVDAVSRLHSKTNASLMLRVDLWLDEGHDDSFPLVLSPGFDEALVSFIRLLLYDFEWQRLAKKGKLPSATVDSRVEGVLQAVVQSRLARYTSDIQTDVAILLSRDQTSPAYMAAAVRIGEQRILRHVARATLRSPTPKVASSKPAKHKYDESFGGEEPAGKARR